MAGVLFIVNVPRREHEVELRKKEKTTKTLNEKDKYDQASKIINELKENKKFDCLKNTIESNLQENDNIVISKCNSTDRLHTNDQETGLYKSKSETTLNVSIGSEQIETLKSSWVKQVMKPKKNKLKITTPDRGVDILATFHCDTPLEVVSDFILYLNTSSRTLCTIEGLDVGWDSNPMLWIFRTRSVTLQHLYGVLWSGILCLRPRYLKVFSRRE